MPELPEVENFRQIILPLVVVVGGGGGKKTTLTSSSPNHPSSTLTLECPPPTPTKRFPSEDVVGRINRGGYAVTDVLRKGKVLCVVLQKQGRGTDGKSSTSSGGKHRMRKEKANNGGGGHDTEENPTITGEESTLYISLHMGMTGRISSPSHVPGLESLSENDAYPPPHTHLILRSNGAEAAFSDPRRFGSVLVDAAGDEGDVAVAREDAIPTFVDIAPDALQMSEEYCAKKSSEQSASDGPTLVDVLANRKKGIKGLLLDQRAVVSGVGNWVADELLYRCRLHPDQSYLTVPESRALVREMHNVLSTAVSCLNDGVDFPEEWLFHRRWRSGGGGGADKDYNGKKITFVQSGGRSTAIVPALQKLVGRKKAAAGGGADAKSSKAKIEKKKSNGTKPKSRRVNGCTKSKPTSEEVVAKGSKRKRVSDEKLSKSQPVRRSNRVALARKAAYY